ncbi:MAG: hypothetical protein LLF76_04710 [Planctomycetaceae bacterium]|nr:hypothetical protein [Planctomycetaceae bacterium]
MRYSVAFVLALPVFSICISGCQQKSRKTVSDLQFNMQLYQVQEVSTKPLVPVAAAKGEAFDTVQYRGWFYTEPGKTAKEGIGLRMLFPQLQPYLLTFELHPPLTKDQCLALAQKENVSNPESMAEIMSLEGYRLSRLVKVQVDEAMLTRQAIEDQSQDLQRANWQLQRLQ